MFRQYGGVLSGAEQELITNSRLKTIVCPPVQQMGKPVVVVPLASKEELSIASQEESPFSLITSKEEFERRVIILFRFERRVKQQRINSCSRSTI